MTGQWTVKKTQKIIKHKTHPEGENMHGWFLKTYKKVGNGGTHF